MHLSQSFHVYEKIKIPGESLCLSLKSLWDEEKKLVSVYQDIDFSCTSVQCTSDLGKFVREMHGLPAKVESYSRVHCRQIREVTLKKAASSTINLRWLGGMQVSILGDTALALPYLFDFQTRATAYLPSIWATRWVWQKLRGRMLLLSLRKNLSQRMNEATSLKRWSQRLVEDPTALPSRQAHNVRYY